MKTSIFLTVIVTFVVGDDLIVTTKFGQLRGKTEKLFNGKNVRQFLGIPFATPPVGELRYKNPLAVKPWSGVKNATELAPSCVQKISGAVKLAPMLALVAPTTKLKEDCLYLNVYVPETNDTNIPVIVFLYGGAFSFGSPAMPMYDGSIFASQENVIFVVIAYRLNTFGFLYLDHPDMDANTGLMDQVLALEWVHNNIASFGGDPNSITLMGQSAGAASVGFHLVSNLTRNYFQRAILQSGDPVSEWAIQSKEENLAFGKKLIKTLGCENRGNLTAVVRCLKEADAFDILKSEPSRGLDTAIFRPVIDGLFITEHPKDSYANRRFSPKSILTGTTKNEGTFFLIMVLPHAFPFIYDSVYPAYEDFLEVVNETFRYASPASLQAIIYEYTPWENIEDPEKIKNNCDNMFADYYFNYGNNEMVKYFAEAGQNVYQYYYAHSNSILQSPKWLGAFHGHELGYIFGLFQKPSYKLSSTDRMFSSTIMRYWANFARTGDPNVSPNGKEDVEWPRYTLQSKEALVLAPVTTAVVTNLRAKQSALWREYIPYIENLVNEGKLDKRDNKWY